jgi:hypothetical protein
MRATCKSGPTTDEAFDELAGGVERVVFSARENMFI